MFLALRRLGGDCPALMLIVSQDAPEREYRALADLADDVLRVNLSPPSVAMQKAWSLRYHAAWWLRNQGLRKAWPQPEHPLQTVLPGHNIDAFFSLAVTEWPLTSVPSVTWIPDLQHRRLPGNFPLDDRASRDRVYLAEAQQATRILVTSEE